MEHPAASFSPHRSTLTAFLVPFAAALGAGAAGCAPLVGFDDPSLLAAPSLVADGRPRDEVAQVIIDADATVSISPGESLGLFVQYARGGHWNLSTTCDTRTSRQACAFDVIVSPAPGASFSGVEGQGLSRDDSLELRSDGSVHLVTATRYGTDGIIFNSDPGAVVRLDALLDGSDRDPFIFFVSEGSVVSGVPTNPVDLSPSAP